ncbi:MAG: sigma-70 family RNA polymerase sigma factor [Nannocystaceae bacterium]|nr:sigma-70 family RNA polymerase sigma factor [Nannocystaceae bacterium]
MRPAVASSPSPDPAALPPALDRVYRAHCDFVHRVALQLGAHAEDVEDVVHDVFLVVHRRLHEYDGRSMRSWLYGITRRVLAHRWRGHRRAREREQAAEPPTHGLDPEHRAAAVEAIARVERFLDGLDADQREVFALIEIEGESPAAVAQLQGVGINTVYSRLRLARRRFARMLDEGGDWR